MKFVGVVGLGTRNNRSDFGTDWDLNLDPESIFAVSTLRVRAFF